MIFLPHDYARSMQANGMYVAYWSKLFKEIVRKILCSYFWVITVQLLNICNFISYSNNKNTLKQTKMFGWKVHTLNHYFIIICKQSLSHGVRIAYKSEKLKYISIKSNI